MSGRELNNRIEYMVTCIGDFASQHAMTPAAAYAFLEKYHGLSFVSDCNAVVAEIWYNGRIKGRS